MANNLIISLVGDLCLCDSDFLNGLGTKSKLESGFYKHWIDNVKSIINGADYTVGNLEGPLVYSSDIIKPSFYGRPIFAKYLKTAGINILNLANNHTLEQGKKGFEDTVNCLLENNISIIGSSFQTTPAVVTLCKNGLKVGIAAFNSIDLDIITNEGCFYTLSEDNVNKVLDTMNAYDVDIKIIYIHWGNEYIHRPSCTQVQLAHKLIDLGVDVIAGHHPHVIQPYESYKNGHIFYSLGNFCFDDLQSNQTRIGMVATISIDTISKNIIQVNLSGVKLSLNNIVEKAIPESFRKYYKSIESRYRKLSRSNTSDYQSLYNFELFFRHFIERVRMKFFLFHLLCRANPKERLVILHNIQSYYK